MKINQMETPMPEFIKCIEAEPIEINGLTFDLVNDVMDISHHSWHISTDDTAAVRSETIRMDNDDDYQYVNLNPKAELSTEMQERYIERLMHKIHLASRRIRENMQTDWMAHLCDIARQGILEPNISKHTAAAPTMPLGDFINLIQKTPVTYGGVEYKLTLVRFENNHYMSWQAHIVGADYPPYTFAIQKDTSAHAALDRTPYDKNQIVDAAQQVRLLTVIFRALEKRAPSNLSETRQLNIRNMMQRTADKINKKELCQ